jgi:hypothetical protein
MLHHTVVASLCAALSLQWATTVGGQEPATHRGAAMSAEARSGYADVNGLRLYYDVVSLCRPSFATRRWWIA